MRACARVDGCAAKSAARASRSCVDAMRRADALRRVARASLASAASSSSVTRASGAVKAREGDARVPYVAALGDTVRKVKLLSLASLAATCAGCPALVELTSPMLAFEAKAAVCGTVVGFGTFTTALLQWFVSPYVKTMTVGADGVVRATKFAWNAREYESTFRARDMAESASTRPLVSWEADGKLYYVEMGGVPRWMYDELDLGRFDDQAKAEAAAKQMKEEEIDD